MKQETAEKKIFDGVKDEAGEQEPTESLELLLEYERHFSGMMAHYSSRADRIDMLMKRHSARRWDAAKKQQMVRRLLFARQTVDQVEPILAQVRVRLEQHSAP